MKFRLVIASKLLEDKEDVEINSLEELIAFAKEKKNDIILMDWDTNKPSLWIYDDYIE